MRNLRLLPLVVSALALLSACGSGGGMHVAPQAPVFGSTPGTSAAQGTAYSYQLAATDPAGGTVSFALSAAPSGAAIGGNTLTWTPAGPQSRVSNSFTVTATTSEGGTATQSWTLTPAGTIAVNWASTNWSATGSTQFPIGPLATVLALVPQSDGSLVSMPGTVVSPGLFNVPNVPAGYYWLLMQPIPPVPPIGFWTSTSTFDAGQDVAGARIPITSNIQTTTFDFGLAGLNPAPATSWVGFTTDTLGIPTAFFSAPQGSTNLTASFATTGNIENRVDWSKINTVFLTQFEPISAGSLNLLALGPELTLTNPSLSSGTTNTINQTLQPSPQTSINLDVPGTQWASLFQNVGPTTASVQTAAFSIRAEPYVSGRNARSTPVDLSLVTVNNGTLPPNAYAPCGDLPFFLPIGLPPILTDQNFGALPYGDPFPPAWTRRLDFCQGANLLELLPVGSVSTYFPFPVVNGESVAPSSSPLSPVAAPVVSPTVNGSSLFTQTTLNTTAMTLSWSAPALGAAPFGYSVEVLQLTPIANGFELLSTGNYSAAKTSITLPPQAPGYAYLFIITAQVDAAANMETSPYRSALPTGFAQVISAPIIISSGATTPAIHGDAKTYAAISRGKTKIPLPAAVSVQH